MLELLIGFGLGAMTFTTAGRELGNKIADTISAEAEKMMKNDQKDKSSKQSAGAAGDNSHPG